MGDINIDPKEAANHAAQIKAKQGKLQTCFNELNAQIKTVPESWKGAAQNALASKVKDINKKSDAFMHDLLEYSKFLEKAAGEYADAEKQISKNAESFMS